MRKIRIFLSTKLTSLSRGNQGSVGNIVFATGYEKVINKFSKKPVRPVVSKTKEPEDVKLLDKKPKTSGPLLVNVRSATGKCSRPRDVCLNLSPFLGAALQCHHALQEKLSCQVYRL